MFNVKMTIALVLGCAENVWEDSERALALVTPNAVFAVKDMIIAWPGRVDYGVTLHPDRTPGYLRARQDKNRNTDFEVWSHKNSISSGIVHHVTADWHGSSGLFAVKIALEKKFSHIILAGVPMDSAMGHIRRKKEWASAKVFRRGWEKHLIEIKDKVRSMSGWTKELLGEPTLEWIVEQEGEKRL